MFRASDGLGNWRQALCLFVSTDSKLILAMYFAIWLCFIMNLVNFFISMNNWLNILSLIWCPDACKTNLVTHFWCDWAHMEKERSVKGSFYDNKWEQCKFAPLSPPRTDHLKITCIWLFMRVLSVIVSNSAWTITSHFKDDLLFMWMKCWLLYCMSSWKNKIFFIKSLYKSWWGQTDLLWPFSKSFSESVCTMSVPISTDIIHRAISICCSSVSPIEII